MTVGVPPESVPVVKPNPCVTGAAAGRILDNNTSSDTALEPILKIFKFILFGSGYPRPFKAKAKLA
jgi:hypothetical protein